MDLRVRLLAAGGGGMGCRAAAAHFGVAPSTAIRCHAQDRPDVLRQRQRWLDGQLDLDPQRLVFIDETWTAQPT
jgi:transposase